MQSRDFWDTVFPMSLRKEVGKCIYKCRAGDFWDTLFPMSLTKVV